MRITLKNYQAIEELDYQIDDEKINFLFGLSGSGKSSISKSLLDEEPEQNKRFGSTSEQTILINGNTPDSNNILLFNRTTQDNYFGGQCNEHVYSVLIDDESIFEKASKEFKDSINELSFAIEKNRALYNRLFDFVSALGAKSLNKGNVLKKSSLISKISSAYESTKNKNILKQMEILGKDQFEWVLDGIKYVKDENCPFCNKKINKKIEKRNNDISRFETKSIELLSKEISDYEELTNNIFKYKNTDISSMEKTAVSMSIACAFYKNIDDDLKRVNELSGNPNGIKPFNDEENAYHYFIGLKEAIKKYNKSLDFVKKKYQSAMDKTKNALDHRLNPINKKIEILGIPYLIEAKYNQKKISDYRLVHNDDSSRSDSKNRLSDGEKSLVALLLFLYYANNSNAELIIIDDPVSSYDEYRRKQIFEFIKEVLKKKTVLILSHDSVFAKYAVLEGKKAIGKVDYFSNYDHSSCFVPMTKSDFSALEPFILENVQSAFCYYQKIMNLRVLYEGKGASLVYGYLSAILHGAKKETIITWLTKKSKAEKDVIDKIHNQYKINLEPIPEDYCENINVDSLGFFEKGLFCRYY